MRLPTSLLFILISLLPASPAAAANAGFSAGAAAIDITPPTAAKNWVTGRPYDGIIDPLEARVLVLASGEVRIAILTLDTVQTNESDVVDIRRAVAGTTGIPSAHILINASHTHSGPMSAGYRWIARPERTKVTDSHLEAWARALPERCAQAARQADAARRPVSLAIGRAHVGEWLFNRRPMRPDGSVESMLVPADPATLPRGLRFGPVDPTATVLCLRDASGQAVATLLHLACHAVSVYSPQNHGLSADWPGVARRELQQALGGEVLFVQGCGGDIVPARRGLEAAKAMGAFIAERSAKAAAQALPLAPAPLAVSHAIVGLPQVPAAIADTGRTHVNAEVQVIAFGDVALVALPGEPLISLSQAIQKESPFPHTLVLGYSNGDGAQYIGLPGEKIRGGYEMGVVGWATDEAGGFLIATALRQLHALRSAR